MQVHTQISPENLKTLGYHIVDGMYLDTYAADIEQCTEKKKVTEKTNQTLIKLITFCRSGGRENCKAHVFISD